MGTVAPRVVVVTRPTDYEALLKRHGTKDQAAFFLKGQGQGLDEVHHRHRLEAEVRHQVWAGIPRAWRRAAVSRAELDRFLFEPEDRVLAVGQDGLVANVAKYLGGQVVIGVDPLPGEHPGVLVRHRAAGVPDLLSASLAGRLKVEARTMACAQLSDGQELLALNELFIGHRSHQSARYRIQHRQVQERHSSSGVVVATGTGATGWARSITLARPGCPPLPGPTEADLIFLVREAWPSPTTGTTVVHGRLLGQALQIVSEMNEGGVCFGDGIESDYLELGYGQRVTLGVAPRPLQLAVG